MPRTRAPPRAIAGDRGRPRAYHRGTVAHDSPIDAYLATLPPAQHEALQHLRAQVHGLVPEAVETMSYGMPAFRLNGRMLLWFAGWKAHCSIYPLTGAFLEANTDALKAYRRTRGSLHFAPEAPLPETLVERMVQARVADLEGATGRGIGARSGEARRRG